MSEIFQKAYQIFHAQKKRCYNKNSPRYKHYGAKGIKVVYSQDKFLSWYVANYPKKKGNWHVGRKDHSKNYTFSNIEFQLAGDNTSERNARWGNPCRTHRKVVARDPKTGKVLGRYDSKRAAAQEWQVSEKTVYNHCQGRTTQFFKYGPGAKTRVGQVVFAWS
jgi:hypothetical protein